MGLQRSMSLMERIKKMPFKVNNERSSSRNKYSISIFFSIVFLLIFAMACHFQTIQISNPYFHRTFIFIFEISTMHRTSNESKDNKIFHSYSIFAPTKIASKTFCCCDFVFELFFFFLSFVCLDTIFGRMYCICTCWRSGFIFHFSFKR